MVFGEDLRLHNGNILANKFFPMKANSLTDVVVGLNNYTQIVDIAAENDNSSMGIIGILINFGDKFVLFDVLDDVIGLFDVPEVVAVFVAHPNQKFAVQ